MVTPYTDNRWNETYYRSTMIIGLAPEGKVRVWLGDRGNPVVPQLDAKITTVSGDKMKMCKGLLNIQMDMFITVIHQILSKGKFTPTATGDSNRNNDEHIKENLIFIWRKNGQ